jgi:hypothetical protein
MFPGPTVGKGACYEGDDVVYTADVDVTAEHCQKWFPECEVPGICPVPPDWRDPNEEGSTDAAAITDSAVGSDATVDASMLLDAARDAP